jgi:hypothetical protein
MKSTTSNIFYIIIFALFIAGVGGWCANIYKIVTTGFELASWGGMEVMRVIGIFIAPLGALLGFF